MAAPLAQVSGLASGINWQQTIQLIMQIESQPMVLLEDRKQSYEDKLSAWQEINTKLLALNSAMEDMDQLDEVLTKAATSSDTDVLTATATSAAATGSYAILVNQLAQSDKWTHSGWADSNSTPVTNAGGTFSYTYGTTTYDVEIPAGATLTEMAQAINNDVNNPGVTATILNDGLNSPTSYHLILSGESGASNTITGITGPPDFGGTWGNTQVATNAQIRVDGYPPGGWIESETNDVTDVIAGVTLNLKTTTATPVTVTVTDDTDAAKEKIQSFVSAYNEVIAQINLDTAYNAETEQAGILFGDGSVIGIKGDLQSIIASAIPGLQDNAVYNSLSEIGVTSGSGGLLSINDSKLSDALTDDFNAVGDLFAFTSSSTSNNLQYFTSEEATQGGVYSVVANFDASGNLLDTTTINGHPVQIDGEYIIGLDGYPEEGLRIKFTDPGGGAGSLTAEIRVGKGDAVRIADRVSFLTDPIDGTIHFAEEGIQDTIDSIDGQIDDWETRLEAIQANLQQEFLAMETFISQMQGQGNAISAMLSQL